MSSVISQLKKTRNAYMLARTYINFGILTRTPVFFAPKIPNIMLTLQTKAQTFIQGIDVYDVSSPRATQTLKYVQLLKVAFFEVQQMPIIWVIYRYILGMYGYILGTYGYLWVHVGNTGFVWVYMRYIWVCTGRYLYIWV